MAYTGPPGRVPVLRKHKLQALLQKISSRFHWFLDVPSEHLDNMTREEASQGTIDAIENGTNNFVVVLVAATGFFTDSYILFATNNILPMLDYVYWIQETSPKYEIAIKCSTLAGCFVGMITFGYLADKFGRQRLYGIVLLTLVGGTLGLIMSSPGYTWTNSSTNPNERYNSMDITALLIFWRFISGLGIGGDYPLSAVMVSEMAPTRRRSYMLAWLFSMQAFGYATATITSIIVVKVVRHYHPLPSQVAVDQIWRWVVGLSLIPAAIAVVMRCFVPESPRFTLYILNYPFRALQDADVLNQAGVQKKCQERFADRAIQQYATRAEKDGRDKDERGRPLSQPEQFEYQDPTSRWTRRGRGNITVQRFWEYLHRDGNGWKLAVTASTWFLLDFTFFGLGFSSPQTVSRIWGQGGRPSPGQPELPRWDTNYSNASSAGASFNPDGTVSDASNTASIYSILIVDSVHSLITSSIGAVLGSIVLILTIEKFSRKTLQWVGFVILALFFIVIGASYKATVDDLPGVTVTLYALSQFFFSFGPNALTFIVAAELFPTKFRCTCHGISAAAGKLGSIIAQIVLVYPVVPGNCPGGPCHFDSSGTLWLGYLLIIFALPMLAGAAITWKWLPELQKTRGDRRFESISLEQLAEDSGEPRSLGRASHEA